MPELIHTCYRIGNIDRSVAFYEALGFEERRRMDLPDGAINVFMGIPGDGDRLELTWNPGVESYDLGTGYNHIALTVPSLEETLGELAKSGVTPQKPPYHVGEHGPLICFVVDPDGYRVELIEVGSRLRASPEPAHQDVGRQAQDTQQGEDLADHDRPGTGAAHGDLRSAGNSVGVDAQHRALPNEVPIRGVRLPITPAPSMWIKAGMTTRLVSTISPGCDPSSS